MFSRSVTRQDHKEPRREGRSKRRSFSRSAQKTHGMNRPSGRPMRGGIRL